MAEPALPPSPPSGLEGKKWRRFQIGHWRFSTVELLVSLVLLFVFAPLVQEFRSGRAIESGLMTLVLIAAVLAVGGRRRTLLVTALLALPAVATKWLHHFFPDWFPASGYLIPALIFMGFVIVNLLWFMLVAPRVDFDVLCASICAYLLLGVLWSLAYTLVAGMHPAAFNVHVPNAPDTVMSGFNAFYFSFVTLTTVGYGDITPVSGVARMLAVMEAVVGQLYVAILIARLVALYSAPARRSRRDCR